MQEITARQYYKAQVLNALLQRDTESNIANLVEDAMEIADTLLEEDGYFENENE